MNASTLALFCGPGEGKDGLVMVHPGLSTLWVWLVVVGMILIVMHAVLSNPLQTKSPRFIDLSVVPLLGFLVRFLTRSPWPLVGLKLISVACFMLVIVAGLWGTQVPERNFATVFTWGIWWAGVVLSVFLLGTAWCAICPWDALAGWLIKRHWWQCGDEESSLALPVPTIWRSVWPALGLFVALSWLELGIGVTLSPMGTASLALLIVVLAVASLAIFERKAFCHYFCPVGRTLGFYARLSPVELRPKDQQICDRCTTLSCYHGTEQVEPCPTRLTMGRFAQNTYCLSCGSCVLSCPDDNVTWRLRPLAHEAALGARPRWDEAWFMVGLLALTSLHGIVMTPMWEQGIRALVGLLGGSGGLLLGFSVAMMLSLLLPLLLFFGVVVWTNRVVGVAGGSLRWLLATLSFAVLPVAFSYHLAHNLAHLVREGHTLALVVGNPLGRGTLPMSSLEKGARFHDLLLPESWLFAVQSALLLWGFYWALKILRSRVQGMEGIGSARWAVLPMTLFLTLASGFNVWLLAHDMVMRF